VDPTLEEGQCE
jgi:serine/threonine protein kinase